jgi:hypothetical protein
VNLLNTATLITLFAIAGIALPSVGANVSSAQRLNLESLVSQAIPKRVKPRMEDGDLKKGWIHIDARHVTGNHPSGAGDLFPKGSTRAELTKVSEDVVLNGTLTSALNAPLRTYEDRVKVQGKIMRVRVVIDSSNMIITSFPVLSE